MTATSQRTDYRLTFVVLCVGVGSFSLLQSMVTPVLATIERGLGTDQATVTWVLTAYLLSASVFTPIVGRVGDKVGKERMLVVALGAHKGHHWLQRNQHRLKIPIRAQLGV